MTVSLELDKITVLKTITVREGENALKYLFCAILAVFGSQVVWANLYEDLELAFEDAHLPQQMDLIEGFWSGRCANQKTKDVVYPAFYASMMRQDANHFPPYYQTQTYYLDQDALFSKFDNYTVEKIKADPKVANWFAAEEWTMMKETNGSFENTYSLNGGVKEVRSVRIIGTEEDFYILLKVQQFANEDESATRYCYFQKKIPSVTGPGTGIWSSSFELPLNLQQPGISEYDLTHLSAYINSVVISNTGLNEMLFTEFFIKTADSAFLTGKNIIYEIPPGSNVRIDLPFTITPEHLGIKTLTPAKGTITGIKNN